MSDFRNYSVAGTPLRNMPWRSKIRDVQITFRPDTPYQVKADFLADLIRSATALRMNLLKNPPADYESRPIDQDVFAKLLKPSMSADKLMALTRGYDE